MRGSTVRFVVFAICTVALTAFIGAEITQLQLGERMEVTARFGDVSGLFEGDPVRVAGVPVGIVDAIAVDGDEAVVTMLLETDVPLPADTGASITWLDLIGARQVDLLPGTSDQLLADGAEITDTRSAVDIGALTAQLGPLSRTLDPEDLNQLLEAVFEVLDGNEQVVVDTVVDTRALLSTVTSRDAVVEQLLTDYADVATTLAEREQQIRSTIDDLTLLAGTFAEVDGLLADGIDDAAAVAVALDAFLDRNGEDITALVEDLDVLVGTFNDNADELDRTLAGLPAALDAFFSVGDQGDLLYVNGVCITDSDPPCQQTARSGGGTGAVRVVDDPATLGRLLRGEGVR